MGEKKINAQLVLKFGGKRAQRLQLINKRYITVRKQKGGSRTEYTIDLLSVDYPGKNRFSLNWSMLLLSLLFLAGGGVLLLGAFEIPDVGVSPTIIAAGLLVAAAIPAFITFKSLSINTMYYAMLSRVPVVSIPRSLMMSAQDKKEVAGFIKKVEHSMEKARGHYDFAEDDQKAGEIRMLRRLWEQGIVSKSHYEKGKTTILGSRLRAA